MTRLLFPAAALVGLIGSGLCVTRLQRFVEAPAETSALEAHEANASASLFGQFRTSLTSWLWLRTDLYMHNGVEMRPLSEAERNVGARGVGSVDNKDKVVSDDDQIVTIVPPAASDFRGILGDIERETSAYKDMVNHHHNNPDQVLPLFRLMTMMDPHFVPGYTTAASVMLRHQEEFAFKKAESLLLDGLRENPGSVPLLEAFGQMVVVRKKDFDRAAKYFEQARKSGLADPMFLDEDGRDALDDTYRWLAFIYHRQNDKRLGLILAEGQKLFPEDKVLLKVAGVQPEIRDSLK